MDFSLSSMSRSMVEGRQVNLSDTSSSEDECDESLVTTINCESDSDCDVVTSLNGDSRRNQSLTMTNIHLSTSAHLDMNLSLPVVPTNNLNWTPKCNFNLPPSDQQQPDVIFDQACRLSSLSGQMRLIKQHMVQQRNQHTEVMQALMRSGENQWQETRSQNSNMKQTLDELKILREGTEVQFSTIYTRLNQVESNQQFNSDQTESLSEKQEELMSQMASINSDLRQNLMVLDMTQAKAVRSFEAKSKNADIKITEMQDEIKFHNSRLNQIENLLKKSASLNTGVEIQTVGAGQSKSSRSRSRKIQEVDSHVSSFETEPEPVAGPRPKKQKTGRSKSKKGTSTSAELSVVAETETASVPEAELLRSGSTQKRSKCTYCGKSLVSTYLKKHIRFTCHGLRKQRLEKQIPEGGEATSDSNSTELSSEINSGTEAMEVDVVSVATKRLRPNYSHFLK